MEESNLEKVAGTIKAATMEVFSTMLGAEITVGEPFSKNDAQSDPVGVVSFLGIAGEWSGTGSLSCSPRMACRIASTFLMAEFASVNEEVLDAFSEITNMTVGNIKNILEEQYGPMALSVPTAIFGRNFMSRTMGRHKWVAVPFRWDGDEFVVQVAIAPQKGGLALTHGPTADTVGAV